MIDCAKEYKKFISETRAGSLKILSKKKGDKNLKAGKINTIIIL